MNRDLAILARGVRKSYTSGGRATTILDSAGLGIARGESVFLVGPSGSGKTTLLSILGCILAPDAGSVRLLGEEVAGLANAARTDFRRRHLGFIFQTFNLFPTLSALDNVVLGLVLRGTPRRQAVRRADDLLGQVGLAERSQLRPATLSTGECQRVAVARALANEPELLLADEPTASLDEDNGRAVMALLTGLVRQRGMTLVVVTHDNRIFPFAERILHLDRGKLARASKPAAARPPARTFHSERASNVAGVT